MEDWQPENPQLLQFDFNACSEQELCEVFSVDPGLARRIFHYRNEAMHVFDLQDLLKVEGVSPEMLQQWTNPPAADPAGFSAELQQSLGPQADGNAPLPKLIETVCSSAGASGCLLIARNGSILIQNGNSSITLQTLAPKIPELVGSLQGDLMQMSAGTARCQVISFEQNDVILLPASAFYLLAIQPTRSLDPARLNLWNATSAEINRRFPPRFFVENHAQEASTDVAFDCPNCVLRILVDSSAVGYTFPCPRCQTPVTVPEQSTSTGSFYEGSPDGAPASEAAPPAEAAPSGEAAPAPEAVPPAEAIPPAEAAPPAESAPPSAG
jgi:hypothetical protein